MNTYKGYPISETMLWVNFLLFSFIVAVLLIVFTWYIGSMDWFSERKKKDREHIKNLKRLADANNKSAKKELERIERRKKRQLQGKKKKIIAEVIINVAIIGLAFSILFLTVIPCALDLTKKDYVVYTGEVEAYRVGRYDRLRLDDGTLLYGDGDFDANDTYGTVIYAKRSKRVLYGN